MMIVMASTMHNTRLLRFLFALTIVVLTIFIYTSYSSTQTLTRPPMRGASQVVFSSNELSTSVANNDANKVSNRITTDAAQKIFTYHANLPHSSMVVPHPNEIVIVKKIVHHREPTIDVNPVDDVGATRDGGSAIGIDGVLEGQGLDDRQDNAADEIVLQHFNSNNNDLMQEEQYVKAVDNTLGIINHSDVVSGNNNDIEPVLSDPSQQSKQENRKQTSGKGQKQQDQQIIGNATNNLNKISESEVLIPTSNLQKFIESADKILQNITVQQRASSVAPADIVNKHADKDELPKTKDVSKDTENDEALPPSVIMTVIGGEPTIKKSNGVESKKTLPSVVASPNVPKGSSIKRLYKVESDPTQGIPTKQIYEPGHMNEEIDINRICPNKGEKLKLLILITSAQIHFAARLAIRRTWGHFGTRSDISTAFILGRTTNATMNAALTEENYIYQDLIRGNFIDSYNNLTLKTLSSLEWVDHYCPKAKYILKTDDDMLINVEKLMEFLDAHAKDKRAIYGRLAKKWKPIRNKKSKYYISIGQFRSPIFPPFTTGPAYVMTSDIVHDLYESSLEQVYLKLEDVFTTGIVAEKLKIKRVHDNMFLNRRIIFSPCNLRKSISIHMIKPNEQFDLWKKLMDQTTICK